MLFSQNPLMREVLTHLQGCSVKNQGENINNKTYTRHSELCEMYKLHNIKRVTMDIYQMDYHCETIGRLDSIENLISYRLLLTGTS